MYHQDVDFGVSLSEIEDLQDFAPIPPGTYPVRANSVALKNTKMGQGKYLQFEFVITSGAYANRKIFQNVMVEHSNEDAKRIGLQWLKSWITSCGGLGTERLTLSFITRFLLQESLAVLIIEEGKAGYADKNKIQRFKKCVPSANLEDDSSFF